MAFKKGQSGNASGRPKESGLLRGLARKHGSEAIEKLVELMRGDDQRLALQACQSLLDRGYGKAAQSIEHSGQIDHVSYDVAVLEILNGSSVETGDAERPQLTTH